MVGPKGALYNARVYFSILTGCVFRILVFTTIPEFKTIQYLVVVCILCILPFLGSMGSISSDSIHWHKFPVVEMDELSERTKKNVRSWVRYCC